MTDSEWYNVYTILMCFVLPVFIMSTSYSLLFRTAMKRSHLNMRSNKNLQASWSSQLKTIVTLLIVTGLFVVAWAPFFTYIALARYLPSALPTSIQGKTHLWRFVKWMHYCNSSLNPFVYAYRNKEFNYSFKMIFHACIKCKRCDEVNRQLKSSRRNLGIRQHTRDGHSFTQTTAIHTMSRRESVRLNDANQNEIPLHVIGE